MAAIVEDVINQVIAFEQHYGIRRRRRRQSDDNVFRATTSAIVCDLVHRELTDPGAWIAIPLSKQKLGGAHRARAKVLNTTLPKVLERLCASEVAFAEIKKGHRSPFGQGRQTVIRRGNRLLARMQDHQIKLDHLKRDPKVLPDPLVLRAKKLAGSKGRNCSVPDTDTTRRYRVEMDRINAALLLADLVSPFGGDDRVLRRIFNNESIEQGGRLFGGFWQSLKKPQRRWIRIDDEPVVALDFGQIAVRIAYSFVKAAPPAGDLYEVPFFEHNRKGIKAILNAMLSSHQVPKRFPAKTRSLFRRAVKIDDVVAAIRRRHPALDSIFGTSACHRIFLTESNILVAVLLRLIDLGVVALPVHDCLLVGSSKKEVTRQTMLDVFREHTGINGVVVEEGEGDEVNDLDE